MDGEDHLLSETFDDCFVPAPAPEIKTEQIEVKQEEGSSDELEVGDLEDEKHNIQKSKTPKGGAPQQLPEESASTKAKRWR